MHLFYEISRAELVKLVKTTAALRQSLAPNGGSASDVHQDLSQRVRFVLP